MEKIYEYVSCFLIWESLVSHTHAHFMFPLFISLGEKRCFWCKDIQENIVDVLPTTSVHQISEENTEEEEMDDKIAIELEHSENKNQGSTV